MTVIVNHVGKIKNSRIGQYIISLTGITQRAFQRTTLSIFINAVLWNVLEEIVEEMYSDLKTDRYTKRGHGIIVV